MTDIELESGLAKLLGLKEGEAVKIVPKDAEAALKVWLERMGERGVHVQYQRKAPWGENLIISFQVNSFPQVIQAVRELRKQLKEL